MVLFRPGANFQSNVPPDIPYYSQYEEEAAGEKSIGVLCHSKCGFAYGLIAGTL